MSRLPCRGSIARAAVLVALLSSRPAAAQVVVVPSPKNPDGPGLPVFTGVWYDVANQAKAEQRLEHLQAKLGRDAGRCDPAAAAYDARRINELRYRIAVDEWLIRQNSLLDPGCYPLRMDCTSAAAIAQAARPAIILDPSRLQTTGPLPAPTIGITITNTGPAATSLAFEVNGVSHQSAGGSRQDLILAPGSILTFDAGGSLGRRQYRITEGLYEFRKTAEGWALYKLPDMP